MASPLAALLPPGVTVVETVPSRHGLDDLLPEERAHVARAVEKRQREFSAGRWAARRALATLGQPEAPLHAGPDRAPRWPAGVVGSITHCASYCAAAVAPSSMLAAIGIDAEEVRAAPFDGWERIVVPDERARLLGAGTAPDVRALFATFATKEAFFKLQWPITAVFVDFLEAEVTLDLAAGRWTIRPLVALAGIDPVRLEGRLAFDGPRVLAAMVLRP